jgi:hypothetical protein
MHRLLVAAPAAGLLLASAVMAQAPAGARVVPERVVASMDSIAHSRVTVADSDATVFPRVASWAVASGVARADAEWPYRDTPSTAAAVPDDSVVASISGSTTEVWPYRIDQSGATAGQLAAGTIVSGVGYAAYWHPYHHHYHYHGCGCGCGCGCGWVYYRYPRWYSPFAARYSLGFVPPWGTAGMAVR